MNNFLALGVEDPTGTLDALVEKMDICLLEYQLPTFYKVVCYKWLNENVWNADSHWALFIKNPSHHVSIAWCVGDKKEELQKLVATFKLEVEQYECIMDEVRCKIGHFLYTYAICWLQRYTGILKLCSGEITVPFQKVPKSQIWYPNGNLLQMV